MRSVLARFDYADRDLEVVGEPDPRIVGPAATLLEAGEDESDLSPTPIGVGTAADPGRGWHPVPA